MSLTGPHTWQLANRLCIGTTVEGRDIPLRKCGSAETGESGARTLLIGGLHGDETATILLLEDFLARFGEELRAPVAVLPIANPDGFERRSRYNARGVDLNRNCDANWSADSLEPPGPAPWSEPESCALRDFILAWQPAKIVTLHWALAEIDADGAQSTPLAKAMWEAMSAEERRPYRLRVTEAGRGLRRLRHTYAICPGSFGQWCGHMLEYADGGRPAMITLELPYDPGAESRPEELPEAHLDSLRDLWHRDAPAYLRAVEPGVDKMLLAACRGAE